VILMHLSEELHSVNSNSSSSNSKATTSCDTTVVDRQHHAALQASTMLHTAYYADAVTAALVGILS
jgi:hypothetical protein